MSKFNKLALAALISASSLTASAVEINFTSGVTATDSSGLTSQFIDPLDPQGTNGFFIETFDQIPGTPDELLGETGFNANSDTENFDSECAVNSLGGGISGVSVTPSAADDTDNVLNVRSGTNVGVGAAPANDETCFGYVTNADLGTNEEASVTFDYSQLLSENGDTGITYLGFYWGSVDTFNDFTFFSNGVEVATLTGVELLAQLDGTSGDQLDDNSNVYVEIEFDFEDQFDTLVFSTRGVAAEFDNIVIGLSQRPIIETPAPAGLALLAGGLLLLSLRSRSKK
ncbi:PEP-CTERM sorting domain-containing protein [Alteromonas sp. 5E99-2]|uniref:Npun_F0296 family exosortase-dependent surface protein n=1 Tax=Alteromonas sp. 5E99-2 TaxID=2817683 RepID=UPI001A982922|nr:PEP-CTERM sorting domain-containing protein [Alteromonas sp. 5E99-2]MBO1256521.1 PEP-CTERM sorting domain-containing protein [Alteromonas sp. 5E99-2]